VGGIADGISLCAAARYGRLGVGVQIVEPRDRCYVVPLVYVHADNQSVVQPVVYLRFGGGGPAYRVPYPYKEECGAICSVVIRLAGARNINRIIRFCVACVRVAAVLFKDAGKFSGILEI